MKYNNKKATRTQNSIEFKFDSKAEAAYFDYLVAKQKAGKIKAFSTQPQFVLTGGFVIRTDKTKSKVPGLLYTADFRIFENDGTETVVEVKGQVTKDYTIRKKLFLSQAWQEFGVSKFIEVFRNDVVEWDCISVKGC